MEEALRKKPSRRPVLGRRGRKSGEDVSGLKRRASSLGFSSEVSTIKDAEAGRQSLFDSSSAGRQEDSDSDASLDFGDGCLDGDPRQSDATSVSSESDPDIDDQKEIQENGKSGEASDDMSGNCSSDARSTACKKKEPHSNSGCINKLLDDETTWADLHLSRPLLKALSELGFSRPSLIQSAAIPPALQGRDLLANAQTGSGKTAAFLLPILERLLRTPGVRARKMTERGPVGGMRGTKALVLLPTRELAMQCLQVLEALAKHTPITAALACGGISLSAQEVALRNQPDVVVATPGRILDLLLNSASVHIELLEVVVLDEADRLLELGFREEILRTLKNCHKTHQTMLFSATLTSAISNLAVLALNAPVHVQCDRRISDGESGFTTGKKRQAAQRLLQLAPLLEQQFVEVRDEAERMAALLHLCRTSFRKRVIVFFPTKRLAHEAFLTFSILGLCAAELHGNLTQKTRIEALDKFHACEVDFLLASELASRGIDVPGVEVVVNFKVPLDVDRYVHCVGRTARMGSRGTAATIFTREDRLAVKRLLNLVQKGKGSDETQSCKVLRRRIDPSALSSLVKELKGIESQLEKKRDEEKREREFRLAEMYLTKASNIDAFADEIYARPARSWFLTNKQRRSLREASKAEAEANSLAPPAEARGQSKKNDNLKKKEKSKRAESTQAESDSADEPESLDEETEDAGSSLEEESELDAELPDWAEEEEVDDDADFVEADPLEGLERQSFKGSSSDGASATKKGVSVQELRISKEQKEKMRQAQLEQQRRKLNPNQTRALTPKQKEFKDVSSIMHLQRLEEIRQMQKAARSVKRNARPKRMRLDAEEAEDDFRPAKKQRQKPLKTRRAASHDEEERRNFGGATRIEAGRRGGAKAGRGAGAPGRKAFKSKKRYKRR